MDAERLRPRERVLASFMSEISEREWCAVWYSGLEYILWATAQGDVLHESLRGHLDDDEAVALRELAEWCGGWIYYDDKRGETWIPLDEWEQKYAGRRTIYG